ncbi:elongator complex protein 3 [Salidesulfovibrio brasiliensis]|uniref:elongator complex protein 3 n=1 Tax=Salidesulfovibrio brasiliensis TaxID=221711 RepID=UPI000ADAFEFC|nr:radical SAM protein [Salidesulfovibrio brasiliensis]
MTHTLAFEHPEPRGQRDRILPVFLPFAGCPYRCVFCAQDRQTGRTADSLDAELRALKEMLAEAHAAGRGPYELAFYGGTFTALPEPWPETFLELAARYRERGLICAVRCSTRPDCVDGPMLARLRGLGLDTVELGIQSFDDKALAASGRCYDGETARRACRTVAGADLGLGIQLLPGLPGDRPGVFQADVRTAATFSPATARLYPCLVIAGTRLARMYGRGEYEPWGMERALLELSEGVLHLWRHGVRVIRIGLAPEGALGRDLLAGPWHEALGQSVRGRALLRFIRERLASSPEPCARLRYHAAIRANCSVTQGSFVRNMRPSGSTAGPCAIMAATTSR